MEQQVSPDEVADYIRNMNEADEAPVEKVLVRIVSPTLYACQTWRQGEREPESYFLHLDEE